MVSLVLPFKGSYIVTQPYGPNNDPLSVEPAGHGYNHFHQGIDYALPNYTQLYAAGAGTVVNNTIEWGYGVNATYIDHGGGLQSLCGHMSRRDVQYGQQVVQGEPIGLSGGGTGNAAADGNSTGPHLHFGFLRNGYVEQDPAGLLSGGAAVYGAAGPAAPSAGVGGAGGLAVVSASVLTGQQAVYFARGAGIPENQVAVCVAIAYAESSLKVAATNYNTNGSTDRGLWQINSIHTAYDAAQLLASPAYNAQAMAAIYKNRGSWADWSTYTNGDYLTYLPQAQRAQADLKAGQTPAGLGAGAGDQTTYGLSGVPVSPQDTTPQQPVTAYSLAPLRTAPGALAIPAGLGSPTPTAAVWARGHWLPVTDATVTATQSMTPGKMSATLSIPDAVERLGEDAYEELIASGRLQVVVAMGYVPGFRRSIKPQSLAQMFTGLIDQPQGSYEGPAETLAVSGPDMSGVFTDPGATSSQFDAFQNQRSDEVVTRLVARHNAPGQPGLSVRATKGSSTLGGLFGSDFVKSRQTNTVEWDVITSLAAGEGFVAFFQGTELYFGPALPTVAPLVLGYRVGGQAAGPIKRIEPDIAPHNKRSYKILVASWDSKRGQPVQAEAGNHDTSQATQIIAPANLSQRQVQKIADSYARTYAAAERTMKIELWHPVPLLPGQPVVIETDRPGMRQFKGRRNPFYPTVAEYAYTSNPVGLTMRLEVSCLPPAEQGRGGASFLGQLGDLGMDVTVAGHPSTAGAPGGGP